MKIRILGSGGWEGVPVPFCQCRVCRSAGHGTRDFRTRPSILVEGNGHFMVEISPDIRLQASRFAVPEIRDFLVSHWHFDHLYGILELDFYSAKKNISVYGSCRTLEWIRQQFPHISLDLIELEPFEEFKLKGVDIVPVPLIHEPRDRNEPGTFGFMFHDGKRKITYLSDYFELPEKTMEVVRNSDIAILDGTYLFEERSATEGKEMLFEDKTHLHGAEILRLARKIGAEKTIFHSITHWTGLCHEELQDLLPDGMFISYDGMEL